MTSSIFSSRRPANGVLDVPDAKRSPARTATTAKSCLRAEVGREKTVSMASGAARAKNSGQDWAILLGVPRGEQSPNWDATLPAKTRSGPRNSLVNP